MLHAAPRGRAPPAARPRTRPVSAALVAACALAGALVAFRSTTGPRHAPPAAFVGQSAALAAAAPARARSRAPSSGSLDLDLSEVASAEEGRASGVAMHGRRWVSKDFYRDGWRFGGRNMWMEDQMGGNWMNISTLKTYTFPSGRLKPRVMTKLRMSDHKRAMRYIKRLRHFGLMPFHRIQAKIQTDPSAKRPLMKSFNRARPRGEPLSAELGKEIDKS
mmetsp:Transcript_63968/g.144371  ORF Transcript_63968/g.144371 Transcript_63968/m.144371 type:complete len:219 (+) Transcript_63968:79-735(+)